MTVSYNRVYLPNSNLTLNTLLNEDGRHLSSVGLLGGDNPEGEADTAPCKGGPFSALTPSMWPAKGTSLTLSTDDLYILTFGMHFQFRKKSSKNV